MNTELYTASNKKGQENEATNRARWQVASAPALNPGTTDDA